MSVDWLAGHIANLTGLANGDVRSQVIPSIQQIETRSKLENHLKELCGTSPAATTFITTYVNSRFPPVTKKPIKSAPSSSKVLQGRSGTTTLVRNAVTPIGRQKKGGAGSGGTIGKDDGTDAARESLAEAFGGGAGQVYIKGQIKEEDLGWGGGGGGVGKGKSRIGTPSGSGRNTPSGERAGAGGSVGIVEQSENRSNYTSGSTFYSNEPSRESIVKEQQRLAQEQQRLAQELLAIEAAKPPQVKKIEKLMSRVRNVEVGRERWEEEQQPKFEDGCFCQARLHSLSPYTPSCMRCGLVLCELQPSYFPCPFCNSTLITSLNRPRILSKLQAELESTTSREEAAKIAMEEEKKQTWIAQTGGGQFPTLGGAGTGSEPTANKGGGPFVPPPVQRTVIRLGATSAPTGAKVKGVQGYGNKSVPTKVIYTKTPTITTTTAGPSTDKIATPRAKTIVKIPRPVGKIDDPDQIKALETSRAENEAWKVAEGRPWGDMDAEKEGWSVTYVPEAKPALTTMIGEVDAGQSKKKRGKGKKVTERGLNVS